jgi:coiled-coil domain-containing protein 55
MHAKALAEDPSVFDYDGVVDHTRDERKMAKQDEKLKRESRYITQIMHHTKGRQREQDVRDSGIATSAASSGAARPLTHSPG